MFINSNLVLCVPWIVEWALEANSTFLGLLPTQVSDPDTDLPGTNNRIHNFVHRVRGRRTSTQPGMGGGSGMASQFHKVSSASHGRQ